MELEEWQQAIDSYENTIENPQSTEDSIFAIIDLGHLYFLMENGSNKSVKGITKYPEYQFKVREDFNKNRDYLLSLLPYTKSESATDNQNTFTENLINCLPNPFNGHTNLYFNFPDKADINLQIFDISGRVMHSYDFHKEEGQRSIELDLSQSPSGIYYYALYVDGFYKESNKMVLSH